MGFKIQLGGRRSQGKPATFVGKLGTTLFLSIFVVVGCVVATLMISKSQVGIDQQAWVERDGTVLSSKVEINAADNENPYVPMVEYTYTHGGRQYSSKKISDADPATNDYQDAQETVLKYPAGSVATVYVSPDEPSQAVLNTGGLNSLGIFAFMAVWLSLFSGIPLVIIITTWWPKRGDSEGDKARASRGRGKEGISGTIFRLIFGLAFTGAGGATLILLTILPLYRAYDARGWNELPCTIERSEVLSYSGSDSTTYRIDILYFYEVNGQRYGSNRYSFSQIGSSSGYDGKRAAADQYPVASQAKCFVNPGNPSQAVLKRGLTLSNLWGLFPLPFLAVGLGCLFFVRFNNPSTSTRSGGRKHKLKPDDGLPETGGDHDGMPVVLSPRGARIGKFIGVTIFALFWNGITSVFVYQAVYSFIEGDPEIFLSIFMIPFVLVGLGALGLAVRQFLLIFAPRILIELDRRDIPLGSSTRLRWQVGSGRGRIDSVTIKLIGEERATYRRGTNTSTDTQAFHESLVFGNIEETTSDPAASQPSSYSTATDQGEAVLTVPLETMHSFKSSNNQVVWKLRVSAKVSGWPDPKDDYDLTVLPMSIRQG